MKCGIRLINDSCSYVFLVKIMTVSSFKDFQVLARGPKMGIPRALRHNIEKKLRKTIWLNLTLKDLLKNSNGKIFRTP